MIDMRHQRHADLLGDFERDPPAARCPKCPTSAGRPAPLMPTMRSRFCSATVGGVDRIHQPDLFALADHDPMREAEDAGMRDV